MHVNLLPVNLGYKGKAEVDNNFVSDTSGKVLDYGFMSGVYTNNLDNFNVSQLVGNLPVYVDVIEKEDKSQFENVDEIFNKSQKSTVLRGRKLKGMEVDLNKYGFKGFLVEERDGFLPISEIDKLTYGATNLGCGTTGVKLGLWTNLSRESNMLLWSIEFILIDTNHD